MRYHDDCIQLCRILSGNLLRFAIEHGSVESSLIYRVLKMVDLSMLVVC